MTHMFVMILALLASVLGIGMYFGISWQLTAVCGAISLFVFGKVTLGMYYMQGHGIFPRRGIYGLNVPMLVMTGVLAILVTCIVIASFTMSSDGIILPETVNNLKALSVTLVVSFLSPYVFWILYLYRATYFGSEYDARIQFKNKGLSDDEIDEKIDSLYGSGAFGDNTGWWPSFVKAKE